MNRVTGACIAALFLSQSLPLHAARDGSSDGDQQTLSTEERELKQKKHIHHLWNGVQEQCKVDNQDHMRFENKGVETLEECVKALEVFSKEADHQRQESQNSNTQYSSAFHETWSLLSKILNTNVELQKLHKAAEEDQSEVGKKLKQRLQSIEGELKKVQGGENNEHGSAEHSDFDHERSGHVSAEHSGAHHSDNFADGGEIDEWDHEKSGSSHGGKNDEDESDDHMSSASHGGEHEDDEWDDETETVGAAQSVSSGSHGGKNDEFDDEHSASDHGEDDEHGSGSGSDSWGDDEDWGDDEPVKREQRQEGAHGHESDEDSEDELTHSPGGSGWDAGSARGSGQSDHSAAMNGGEEGSTSFNDEDEDSSGEDSSARLGNPFEKGAHGHESDEDSEDELKPSPTGSGWDAGSARGSGGGDHSAAMNGGEEGSTSDSSFNDEDEDSSGEDSFASHKSGHNK